jgi:6-pyruvoyltetrahydropterin/6-carboxytetrahydropterin synthase
MYELAVERDFSAAHALAMSGRRESAHDHDWRVSVTVAGRRLDRDGLLCDFHLIEQKLETVLGGLHNRDLNRTPPFDSVNPTAEMVARHIAEAIEPALPEGVVLTGVSVTEAPGCTATYRPE